MDNQDQQLVKVVVVRPPPLFLDFHVGIGNAVIDSHLANWSIPKSELSGFEYGTSPLSAQLGLPVQVKAFRDGTSEQSATDQVANAYISTLFCNPDVNSPNFGVAVPPPTGPFWSGVFVVARCDGEDLDARHLLSLISYITRSFSTMDQAQYRQGTARTRKTIKTSIARKLTRRAFSKDYEERRQRLIAQGVQIWQHLQCPVQIDEDNSCAFCGNPGLSGGTRFTCGRCRSARYCGVDCQRAHWSQHREICRAPGTS